MVINYCYYHGQTKYDISHTTRTIVDDIDINPALNTNEIDTTNDTQVTSKYKYYFFY